MTPATATLALKFCEAVFAACPWAAPATWTPRQTFEDLLNQMTRNTDAPRP